MYKNEKGGEGLINKSMENRAVMISMIFIILAVIFAFGISSVSAANWTVGPDGTYNYTSINDAVTGSTDNDTIDVYDDGSGNGYTYIENVVINKNLTLRANGAVTVQASDPNTPVFTITSSGSGSTIQGFTITGATNSNGIYLNSSNNTTISGNTITQNYNGIYMNNSSGNVIEGNQITYNTNNGIELHSSDDNTISGNTISSDRMNNNGIYMDSSSGNVIDANEISNNGNIGIYLHNSSGNHIGSTTNPNLITRNKNYGIYLESSSNNNIISGNQIIDNTHRDSGLNKGYGIYLDSSNSNTISGNQITSNYDGITSSYSSNNHFYDNALESNMNYGFYLYGTSTNNNIYRNIISSSYTYGIWFADSASANVNFNSILDSGIANDGSGTINARNNWWGSNSPDFSSLIQGSGSASVIVDRWIILKVTASPSTIPLSGTSTITADLTHNNLGEDTSAQGHIPDGTFVSFYVDPDTGKGTLDSDSASTENGQASTNYNAGTEFGTDSVSATVDGVTVNTPVTVGSAPDLVSSSPTTNSNPYTGTKYPVNVTITNNGSADAGAFTVELFDGTTSLGTKTVNEGLAAGHEVTLTWDWTPLIGTPGIHTLLAAVDLANVISESNELNNNATSNILVTGMPDLIVLNNMTTNSTGNIYTGIKYTVYTTIKNNRDASTGNSFNVKLYDNGTPVNEQTVNGLNAGQEQTLTWDWTPLTVGNHTLLIVADSLGQITENDETNNNNTTDFAAIGRPDLNATSITTNGTIYTNVTYPVNVTVKNNGDANAGQFTVELFDGLTSLGKQTVSEGLAINAETILTWNWTPAFKSTGIHNLIAVIDSLGQYEINGTNNNITLNVNTLGRPDLIALNNMTTNSTGTTYTGIPYTVYTTIKNNGDAATGNSFNVKLFDNGAPVAEQTVYGGLDVGEFRTLTWTWTPIIGTPGIHTLLIATDSGYTITESDETNNNNSTNFPVTGMPDLIILDNMTTNSTGNIYTGIKYTVYTTIKNNRDASTGNSFNVKLYDNGTPVNEQTVNGLNAGQEQTLTWDWTPLTVGNHTLLVVADSLGQIIESDETNNNNSTIFAAIGRPDLNSTGSITVNSSTIYTNNTYSVNATITNNGDASSGGFDVELKDGATSLGIQHIDSLAIGATRTLTWIWTVAFGSLGDHNLQLFIDLQNLIYESNETNNQVNRTINVLGRPDLVPTNLTTNGTVYTNVTYPVNVTMTNNGDANAGQFTVELFDGSTSLGTKTVTGLAVNANTVLTWNWTPAFGAVGIHNLKIVVDSLSQIYESNETNNNITLDVNAIGRPDLISSNLATNGTIYTGITYPVSVIVTNNGDGNAGTFTVKLLDGSTGIGWIPINGLAAGTSTNITFNWTPITAGLHTLQIRTDTYNNVTESNETNNILNQDITATGRPDLIPSNLTTNSTIYTGVTYPVNVTITNNGNADAGSFNVELFDGTTSLGTKTVTNLGIGASTVLTWNWISTFGATGIHNLKIVTDTLNQIYESNENNNNITANFTAIGRPDLIPKNLTTNGTPYTGVTCPVNVTITNNGDASAGSFVVELFDGTTSLGTKTVTNLGIGSSTILTWNWMPLTVENHILKIVADSLNQQYEIDETNNNITIDVNANGRPDLVPSNLTTNGTINTTFTYPVSVKIANNGDADAGSFNVELFDGSTSLGTKNVTSLGMGANTILTWNWTPAFGTAGLHNLKAVIDSLDQQYEINETNNNITLNVTATGKPDLISSNIITNGTVYTGIIYPVNVTVTNNGDGDAGTFTVKLYDGSTGIGWITVNGLAAGTSTNIIFNWTPTTAGLHTLLIKTDFYNNVTEFNETNNDLYKNITVTAISDLIPTNLQKPASPTTNITYPIIVTVKNNGTANAGTFTVKLLDGTTGIGWITVNGLAAGTSTNVTFNWKPTTLGLHTLRAVTDFYNNITESNETNNEITQNITVIPLPDLIPSNLQAPNNPTTGITYPVIVAVKNNGTANAGTFTVKLYDGSTGIGWITVNGLAVGANTNVTFNWKPTTLGLHTLRAVTDTYNNITESNETNNEINQTTTVLLLSDLIPSNLQVPSNPFVGISYPITVKITNRGTANAGTFTVKLLDGTKGIGWITVNGLAVGANTNVTFNWTPTTIGLHTLRIITDTYNNITESNETNNEINQTIAAISGPDLIPSNLQLPNNPQLGQTYPITATISNNGGLDAGIFTVKLYDGSTGIGWITVNGLAAGTSTNITFNWTPTTAGLHTLQVIADYYNNITESNETNNQITQNITITSGPDLIPSNLQLPINPQTGQTYPLTVTITNNGIVDAGSFTVKLYDGTKGIGWVIINGLAAGASTNVTFNWTLTTTGTHTLQVIADYYNNITESNENNNQITQNITVT